MIFIFWQETKSILCVYIYIYIVSKCYSIYYCYILLSHVNSHIIILFPLVNKIILFSFFFYLSFNASIVFTSASITPMTLPPPFSTSHVYSLML